MASKTSSPPTEQPIARMRLWVERFVVSLNVCPFARREVKNGSIRYILSTATDDNSIYDVVTHELQLLADQPQVETTLILLPGLDDDFEAFLNTAGFAEQIIQLQGLSGEFQLAHFHPEYLFSGADANDPANFTNRAPHAALHLLREESVERAVRAYKNAEDIPQQNIEKLRELGLSDMQKRFNALFKS